jgi:hypothetical protein
MKESVTIVLRYISDSINDEEIVLAKLLRLTYSEHYRIIKIIISYS